MAKTSAKPKAAAKAKAKTKTNVKVSVSKGAAKVTKGNQSYAEFFQLLKETGAEYVSFRFTVMRGKLQHTAQHIMTVDEDLLTDGIMFDGSSLAGKRSTNPT